jgi:imidazole glycerol-phosphate synthase subunit HisH
MEFGIIDYGMGNLCSVRNAFDALGARVRILEHGAAMAEVGAVILPGVGAFGAGMKGLKERGFLDALSREVRDKKKPILGICLGLQLFARRGLELGDHEGLGWVPGEVRRFAVEAPLRVPHIGWNTVDGKGVLWKGIPPRTSFYFVHSYHLVPDDPKVVSGTTAYGETFVSMIEDENVMAVQFHPEKSHKHGISLLRNFIEFTKRA